MAKCGDIEKARWWIVNIFCMTLWDSQPRCSAMIMLVVGVGTEEVKSIDVDFNRYIEMFYLYVERKRFFSSRDELFFLLGALSAFCWCRMAWSRLEHGIQVMKQVRVKFERFIFNRHNKMAVININENRRKGKFHYSKRRCKITLF